MKFHSKIFGWEYAWQEYANERGGVVELDPEAHPSLKYIQLSLEPAGSLTFSVEPRVGAEKPDASAMAYYPTDDQFVFALHTEKVSDKIGKLLGMQDIVIGDMELDSRFVIQSNDPNRFKEILQNFEIRQLLLERPEMTLRVFQEADKLPKGANVPAGHYAIHYKQNGMIETFEELRAIHQLLSLLVSQSVAPPEKRKALRPRFSESLLKR